MRGPPSAKHPCRGVAVSLTLGLVLPLLHLHASVGSFILASKHQWNVTCSYGPVSLKAFLESWQYACAAPLDSRSAGMQEHRQCKHP